MVRRYPTDLTAVQTAHDQDGDGVVGTEVAVATSRPRAADVRHEPVSPARRPRTVLVIASRFPPIASVGSSRVRKLIKYLPSLGWRPVVITGAMPAEGADSHDARRATDLGTLRDLPKEAAVHRLAGWLDDWPNELSNRWGRRLSALTRPVGLDHARWKRILDWRLQRVHDRLSMPDRGIWRLGAAVRLAMRLRGQYRFDAILSTGMPFSDHVIALVLQSILRRPWLADFRDPWVEYIHWQQWGSRWGQRVAERLESAVIHRATSVISVNDHMTRRFRMRYPDVRRRKFVTIENGFDPSDFARDGGSTRRSHFRLLYAGSLYGARHPRAVIEAFNRFLSAVPGSRTHARFDFAGRPGPHAEGLAEASDGKTLRYLGFLSHAAALREMSNADVNVVILPNVPGGENDTTTKLYECLGSGRAILAAVPVEGAAARALRGFGGVWLRDPDDVQGIADAIGEMYRQWLAGTLPATRPAEAMGHLTRRYQAGQLAAGLNAAVGARAEGR